MAKNVVRDIGHTTYIGLIGDSLSKVGMKHAALVSKPVPLLSRYLLTCLMRIFIWLSNISSRYGPDLEANQAQKHLMS